MEKFSFLSFCPMAATHPSTNQSQRCVTSVISRELVCQRGYGVALAKTCMQCVYRYTANHGYKSSILLLFFFSYIRSALITIESFNTPIYYTYHSQNKKKMASLGIRRPPMRSKSKLQLIGFKEEKERREKKKQFSENYRKETSL